jgi:L-amino acid N-acyltransferase YncA
MLTKINQHINMRSAKEADMPRVAEIYNQAIDLGYVTADTEHVSVESRKEFWLTLTQKQDRPFWVAENDGKVVGFFYFRNFYDRPAYRITAEIGIYIDISEKGKGLGKLILDYCIKQAPEMGIENILALIFASNKNSMALFEKAGFEKKGEFKDIARYGVGYNDLVILQKKI